MREREVQHVQGDGAVCVQRLIPPKLNFPTETLDLVTLPHLCVALCITILRTPQTLS